jgi:hypothetical protein
VVIPTNGIVFPQHKAVMTRGLALQAAERFLQLPAELGSRLMTRGNHVFSFAHYYLFTFPTKAH